MRWRLTITGVQGLQCRRIEFGNGTVIEVDPDDTAELNLRMVWASLSTDIESGAWFVLLDGADGSPPTLVAIRDIQTVEVVAS